jgi:hypothetical protein
MQLGERHLWVDQYCVNQHEHDIKNIQIGGIDHIYAGAYATIVVAAGSNADDALPGVSRPRSHTQRVNNQHLNIHRVASHSYFNDLPSDKSTRISQSQEGIGLIRPRFKGSGELMFLTLHYGTQNFLRNKLE